MKTILISNTVYENRGKLFFIFYILKKTRYVTYASWNKNFFMCTFMSSALNVLNTIFTSPRNVEK